MSESLNLNQVSAKCLFEVERLIKGINELKKDSSLYVLRSGSTGGYLAGTFYGLYIYNNITFEEDFPRVLEKVHEALSSEYKALIKIMNPSMRFYEPLKWFMIGFLSALEELKKEVEKR